MRVIQTECLITSDMSSQLQHAQQGKREGRKYIFLSQVCTARKQASHFSSSSGVGVGAVSQPGNGGGLLHIHRSEVWGFKEENLERCLARKHSLLMRVWE